MSSRRQVRERVLQALFALELSGDDAQHVMERLVTSRFKDNDTYRRFAEALFIRALDAREEVKALLDRHIENWDVSRLALTDRLTLHMAIAELLHFEEIPPKVTLDEAVEVARAFGTDNSASFVNGVLDAVLQELRRENRLTKTGRGLVDFTPGRATKKQRPAKEPSAEQAS